MWADENDENLLTLFDQISFTHGDNDAIRLSSGESVCYLELQELSILLSSQLFYRYRPTCVLVDCNGHVVAETVALLACLRLNVPFVPVSVHDQHAAAGRLGTVVQSLRKHILGNIVAICGAENDRDPALGVFYKANMHTICYLDRLGNLREQIHVPRFPGKALVNDDLYILFTSGTSSGAPKAVKGSHKATFRRLQWFRKNFQPSSRVARRTHLTFVDSITELFGTLLHPPSVLVAVEPEDLRDNGLVALLDAVHPTQITMLPSQLATLLLLPKENFLSLDRIIISGEPCPVSLVGLMTEKLPSNCQVLNLYGQTESTGDVLAAVLTDLGDEAVVQGVVAVGSPILPSIAVELAENGEFIISGNLANGYLGEERPFEKLATGDVGFAKEKGELSKIYYIKGRCDDVGKVNGILTSPSEVEAALTDVFETKRVAVVILDGRVYAVCEENLSNFSREKMSIEGVPWNLIPVQVFHNTIPISKSGAGKVDRSALRELVQQLVDPPTLPSVPRKACTLETIVCEILQLALLDDTKSFVDIGGDSASAVHILYRLRNAHLLGQSKLSAYEILHAESIADVQLMISGVQTNKRRRIHPLERMEESLAAPVPVIHSPDHCTIPFLACVDSSPVLLTDSTAFYLACQGGLICKIHSNNGVQAHRYFPEWKFQADCLVVDTKDRGRLVVACGFNDHGQSMIVALNKDLDDIVWQREMEGIIKATGICIVRDQRDELWISTHENLISVNADNGEPIRRVAMTNDVFSRPILDTSNKCIWFVGSTVQKIDYTTTGAELEDVNEASDSVGPCYKDCLLLGSLVVICDTWGQIHVLDTVTSKIKHTLQASSYPLSSPIASGGAQFLVGTYEGYFLSYFLSRSQEAVKQWEVDLGASVYCRPAILPWRSACIVCTTAGDVVIVRVNDGVILERRSMNAEIWSNPVVVCYDEGGGFCKVAFGARDSKAHVITIYRSSSYNI